MEESELSTLNNQAEGGTEFRDFIVDYTGKKHNPENDEVTLEMIIDTLSEEFPEVVLFLSEENWVRGYKQALTDVEEGEKMFQEQYE